MMRLCPFMGTMDGGQVALPASQKKLFLFLCFENEKNEVQRGYKTYSKTKCKFFFSHCMRIEKNYTHQFQGRE